MKKEKAVLLSMLGLSSDLLKCLNLEILFILWSAIQERIAEFYQGSIFFFRDIGKLKGRFLGMDSLPFRFLTPFSFRPSRLLRNSLRSNILAGRLHRLPSKAELRRLNLQRSLKPSPKTFFHHGKKMLTSIRSGLKYLSVL